MPSRKASRAEAIIVGLMFGLSMMSYFDRTILSIAGPSIMKEFGISEVQMGSVYSAFLFSYALLMIPGGRMADRFGPRLVLTWMAFGSAVFTALLAWAGTPGLGALFGIIPSFIIIRLAFGVFTAPLYPTCTRMNANWIPTERRAGATGLANAGAGFGGAVSPLLFTWMMAHYGWRRSFILAGLATAALGAVWFFYVRDHPDGTVPLETKAPKRAPWLGLLTDRNVVLLTLGFFALDYFEYIFFYWIFYYLQEIRHLSTAQSAGYTTVLFLAWVIMMPLGGWVSDRLGSRYGQTIGLRTVAIASLGLSAVLLFAGAAASEINTAVGLMSLALGFAACADVTFWAATIEVAGEHCGAAGGIMNMGGNAGGFLAPIVTPYIAVRAGWTWGLYFGCVMALASLVAWLFIDPERKSGRRRPKFKNRTYGIGT
jgi:ACS family glucarate transporter-like MFS transporter